ncbi:MAG: hypothetical protein M1132_03010 [Chloroflexi bacterium]|nr:hypothetical protein [Chloroflexota bacterium]
MGKKVLVLLAASALLIMACDVTSIAARFIPQNVKKQVEDQASGVAPTLAALATGVPETVATSNPMTGPTKAAAATSAPTKAASSGASTGNLLTDAANKAKGMSKYRMEFSMIFGGMDSGKYQEQPFMNFKGEVDGKNSHFTSTGGIMAMLAGDEKTPLEFIEVDGKSYVKGMGLMGVYDPKVWYIDTNNTGSSFSSMTKPDDFADWTSGAKTGDLQKVRSESFDGQTCDVYLYNMKSLQNAALVGLLGSASSKSDFGAVDKAEMNFWLCKDGLVHKFTMDYEGHDTKDTTQKSALKMNAHMYAFNDPTIVVQAPKDAKPMPK